MCAKSINAAELVHITLHRYSSSAPSLIVLVVARSRKKKSTQTGLGKKGVYYADMATRVEPTTFLFFFFFTVSDNNRRRIRVCVCVCKRTGDMPEVIFSHY